MEELIQTITRLRRATTNRDVLAVCDALERFILDRAKHVAISACEKVKPRFDKTAYQRELMRKRRAKAKGQFS
jgi:hypothetical protein